MSDVKTSISRLLDLDGVTDMEAALFIVRRMEATEMFDPVRDDSAAAGRSSALGMARELIEELENPYARKLLADTLDTYKEKP